MTEHAPSSLPATDFWYEAWKVKADLANNLALARICLIMKRSKKFDDKQSIKPVGQERREETWWHTTLGCGSEKNLLSDMRVEAGSYISVDNTSCPTVSIIIMLSVPLFTNFLSSCQHENNLIKICLSIFCADLSLPFVSSYLQRSSLNQAGDNYKESKLGLIASSDKMIDPELYH